MSGFGPIAFQALLWGACVTCGIHFAITSSAQAAQPAPAKAGVARAPTGKVLARVDGIPVTQTELDRMLLNRRVPEKLQAEVGPPLLEELIDNLLMRKFLAVSKAEANERELNDQVARLQRFIEAEKPADAPADVGYDLDSLRAELALPLAWQTYLARVVTDEQIRDYFDSHRARFDGTQLRASHILRKMKTARPSSEIEGARRQLAAARTEIEAGKTTFADVARKLSQAPSADEGGDIGYFTWSGRMPADFSRAAFALEVGELSQPFTTPFGVHLCVVTDRKPGELSLEDARAEVLTSLSQDLWKQKVAELRAKAKIERPR